MAARAARRAKLRPQADPRLCERCGRCCCKKMVLNGEVVYMPLFCEYHDKATRLCTIYHQRHEINPHCLTVEEGIELSVFPADCPYVRGLPDYRPPRTDCTPEELQLYKSRYKSKHIDSLR